MSKKGAIAFEKAFQQAVRDCYAINRKCGIASNYKKCNAHVWDLLVTKTKFEFMEDLISKFDKLPHAEQVTYALTRPELLEARR